MILWMSSETDTGLDPKTNEKIGDILWKLYMSIEKQTNTYLKEIEYKHPKIEEIRIVFVLRDDDFSVMAGGQGVVKKSRGELAYGVNIKLDYNRFKNGDNDTRKKMIYEGILSTVDMLQKKKLNNLEPVKDYIQEQIDILA
jgi:hypothetical protein